MSGLVGQVPAVVERVRREIVLARFVGKLAVDQGLRELRQRVEQVSSPPPPDAVTPAPDPGDVDDEILSPQRTGDADALALADYDQLPASDIVGMLHGLEADERDAIEAHERAGRGRRTILGKLAQLRDQP